MPFLMTIDDNNKNYFHLGNYPRVSHNNFQSKNWSVVLHFVVRKYRSKYLSKSHLQSYASYFVHPPTLQHSAWRLSPHPLSILFSLYYLFYLTKPQLQDLICRTVAVTCAFRTESCNRRQDPGNYYYQFWVESIDFSVFGGQFMCGMLNTLKSPKPSDTILFVSEAGLTWELLCCSFVVYGHQNSFTPSLSFSSFPITMTPEYLTVFL